MVIHNTILNPQQLFLKSNEGRLNNSTKKSSISFELKNVITIPNNVDAYIQLNSFKFINAFYNISSTNNIFYYSVSTMGIEIIDEHSIEIPIGNYNLTSLLDFLNGELLGYITITYSSSTFKLTFTADSGTLMLRDGVNNCLRVLGFNNTDTIESNILISPNLINLSGIQLLYIALTNFSIASNSSKDSIVNNILESVNIEVSTGTTQSFTTSSHHKYKIIDSSINKIDIDIYDENNELVDFNNTDFYLNMSFIFVYKMEHIEQKFLDLNNNDVNDAEEEAIEKEENKEEKK